MIKHMFSVAILAGGLAKRLHPLTETIPKALVDINGAPFIAHQLRLLRKNSIERVVICAGHLGEMISEFVCDGSGFGIQAKFSFDGSRLLGTAGTVRKALPLLGKSFFVLYGDAYLPCDYVAVQEAYEKSGKSALMTVFHNEDRWDKSNVEFEHGRILNYNKEYRTDRMYHIDYGLGVFRASAFEMVPENEPFDLAWVYKLLLEKGELAAFEVRQRFYEIGTLEGLKETRHFLKSHGNRNYNLSND